MTDVQIKAIKELRDACEVNTQTLSRLTKTLLAMGYMDAGSEAFLLARIDQAAAAIKKVEAFIV